MSGGFSNPIIGGGGTLVYPSIHSPNFITGISGWSINKDGSAEFDNLVIRGTFNGVDWQITKQGLFFYAGTPATGNLVASIAPHAGANDGFGNSFPAGFAIGQSGTGQIQLQPNVNQAFDISTAITGVFTAMAQYWTGDANQMMPSMLGSVLLGSGTATKMSAVMHSPFAAQGAVLLLESQNDGGTDTPVITFGTVSMPDGMTMVFTPIMTLTPYALVLYSGAGSHVVVTKTSGSGTIPIPVGVTTAKAECWGAGGGGGGGLNVSPNSEGGVGGGGGEYAAEPNLAVTGGGTVAYSVGAGGTGNGGGSPSATAGANSTLTGASVTVTAHGPTAASGLGAGGSGSTNTVHFNGGSGSNNTISASPVGGSGSGSSAGVSSAGNNGSFPSGSTGGNGGAAVASGGAGGAGGSYTNNVHPVAGPGTAGSAPGGGGGGGSCGSGLQGNGGNGASGQVRLTYTNGVPTVGFSINFGAAFNDQFGTSIPAGINTATKITESGGLAVTGGTTTDTLHVTSTSALNGTVTAPDTSTLASNGIHVATTLWGTSGTLTVGDNTTLASGKTATADNLKANTLVTLPDSETWGSSGLASAHGLTGKPPIAQTDITTYTVTQATATQASNAWSIPANDPQVGTVYRLKAAGNGKTGTTQETLTFQLSAFGTVVASFSLPAAFLAISTNFGWALEGTVAIHTTGVSGSYVVALSGTLSIFGSALTGSNSFPLTGQNSLTTVNTTVTGTIELQANWGATTGAPTLSTFVNTLERLGP